jgi:hypothetical protein
MQKQHGPIQLNKSIGSLASAKKRNGRKDGGSKVKLPHWLAGWLAGWLREAASLRGSPHHRRLS